MLNSFAALYFDRVNHRNCTHSHKKQSSPTYTKMHTHAMEAYQSKTSCDMLTEVKYRVNLISGPTEEHQGVYIWTLLITE